MPATEIYHAVKGKVTKPNEEEAHVFFLVPGAMYTKCRQVQGGRCPWPVPLATPYGCTARRKDGAGGAMYTQRRCARAVCTCARPLPWR